MFANFCNWLDDRTGYRKLVQALLIEHIPGGAKWRYVWGSCLAFVFMLQLVTGLLLMTAYSPSDSTAWSSVFYIQYKMDFGWLIRGLHHFGSQAMVVLLGIHMLQVVIAGAHLPPREVNWWLGMGLLGAVLGLSLTGYLLPWDQKGFWATQVATNIAGNLPAAGTDVQKIVVGGPEYGNHTLTRFYALHVAILPAVVIVLIILHLAVFRRHGVTAPKDAKGQGWFWPDQAFRDMVVSMLIFGVLITLVLLGHGHSIDSPTNADGSLRTEESTYETVARAGEKGLGANLDAPADRSRPYPARPEWYFLFLFQLLKYFEGEQEIIGTVLIPMGVGLLLFLLPLFGRGNMRRFGHSFGVIVIVALLTGAGALTYLAMAEDFADPSESEKARVFQKETAEAEKLARRAIQLANDGIPAEGPVYLLRNDPKTQGPVLFQKHCATCHTHDEVKVDGKNKPKAPDLTDFGSKKWIADFLRAPGGKKYFGRLKDVPNSEFGDMADEIQKLYGEAGINGKKNLEAQFDKIADWLSSHSSGKKLKGEQLEGYKVFQKLQCNACHRTEPTLGKKFKAPNLAGYGSADWLRTMISSPGHPLRYGKLNQMPAFRNLEGPAADMSTMEYLQAIGKLADMKSVKFSQLTEIEREIIVRWLRRDYRVVFGGSPISGAEMK